MWTFCVEMKKCPRILFLHDNLFLTPDANVKIVFRLIQYLLKNYKVDISLLGRATCAKEYVDEYQGCRLIHRPHIRVNESMRLKKKLGRWNMLRYLLMPRTISYHIHKDVEPYVVEARKWLKKHIGEYDVVIATCSPYYPLLLASEISEHCPVIFYKIDPVATFPIPNNPNQDTYLATMDREISFDSCASKIITTDVIFKYYNQLPTRVNVDKVVLLNYPNIVERKLSTDADCAIVTSFDKTKINMCFIGTFYQDIRNPQFLLNLMQQLQNTNMVLHIIGNIGNCGALIKEYTSADNSNIVYHGVVSPIMADDIMLQADILVHVGNASDAYMPSKILDYISSGKPILNLCKIPSCPTLPLMARYPLGLTVYEYDELTENIISKVVKFCDDNTGKQIPFTMISELYYDSTIEYVGQKFYEVIESVIKE